MRNGILQAVQSKFGYPYISLLKTATGMKHPTPHVFIRQVFICIHLPNATDVFAKSFKNRVVLCGCFYHFTPYFIDLKILDELVILDKCDSIINEILKTGPPGG